MNEWTRARGMLAVLILFCAAGVILLLGLGRPLWAGFMAILLALGILLHLELRRLAAAVRCSESGDDAEKNRLYLQTLNHQRHDYMNDIQVLYGYVRMKKYDKLLDFVENMKNKAARESSISRLGTPAFAMYLHSFRVRHRSVELEVELDQDIQLAELPIDAERTEQMAMALMEAMAAQAAPSSDEPDRLAVELYTEEDALYICFEFYGESDAGRLGQAVEEALQPYRESLSARADSRFEDRWATVEVKVPFREQAASA